MIATVLLILALAAVLEPLLRRDLARACRRRADRMHPPIRVTIGLDVTRFVQAMNDASRAMGPRFSAAVADLDSAMRDIRTALDAGAISSDRVRDSLGLNGPGQGTDDPGPEKPVF